MIHFIGHTQNDLPVYVDLIGSDAAKHIARQPHLLTLAAEVLQCIAPKGPTVRIEYDMGRVVGQDAIVKTVAGDSIFYVQLVQDNLYTRFTKNGRPPSTSYVSIVLQRSQEDALYTMHDIRIGHLAPPRPGSTEETAESKTYWQEHAVVFEHQPMQSRTVTKTCPY